MAENKLGANAAKTIGSIGTSLTHKNLIHPSNWNMLFDFFMVIAILVLALIDGIYKITNIPFGALLIIGFVFILLCFIWLCYCQSKTKK